VTPDLVVVVVDGDFARGAGVLFNSLHRRGFGGVMVVAGRGSPPPWWTERVSGGARLVWETLPAGGVAARWKPWAIARALARFPEVERWFFFDADIVIKAPWSWFQHWADSGLAVVEDLFGGGRLAAGHPWRRWWAAWLTAQGAAVQRPGGVYVNSGFLGGCREQVAVVERWEQWLTALVEAGVPADALRLDPASPARWAGPGCRFFDQDALNLALMTGTEPLAAMEPAAMDLGVGGEIMAHAMDMAKPWRMRPWTEAWRGTAPAEAQRAYWREAAGELGVWTEDEIRQWREDLAGAYAWTRWPLGLKVLPRAVGGWWRERRRKEAP